MQSFVLALTIWTKQMPFTWMSMNLAQKYYFRTLLLHLYWRQDRHFTWSSESNEGLAACSANGVPWFLSNFFFSNFKIRPQESSRYVQSSALPTELILPWSQLQYLLETSYFNTKVIVLIIKIVFVPRLLENNDIFIGNIIFDNFSLIQNESLKHCKLQFSCLCENFIFARSWRI